MWREGDGGVTACSDLTVRGDVRNTLVVINTQSAAPCVTFQVDGKTDVICIGTCFFYCRSAAQCVVGNI